MHKLHRLTKVAAGAGIVLTAAALLWWAIAVPALVKYPTDLNLTIRYSGTFTLAVDPATAAPLAAPITVPLTVDRHIQSVGAQSGANRVVVDETITQHAGDLVNTTQHNVYVMDRASVQNVADSKAYAFDPANQVDRSGAYRLNLPFDTDPSGTYRIYKNEIGTTYEMHRDAANPTANEAGLSLDRFTASISEAPLTAAYVAELSKTVPLPASLTLDQLKPQLKALGVDVDALLAALAPSLTADDLAALGTIAANPIPLQYVLSFDGGAAVEPTTGAEVDVKASETVGARPQLNDLATLQGILAHYPTVPEATAASQALTKVASAPAVTLFSYSYQQTPLSVVEVANKVSSMRDQVRLAQRTVPFALLGLGFAAFITAAIVQWRRHAFGPLDVRHAPPSIEHLPERQPTTSGGAR